MYTIITGAAGGIGKATAKLFAERNMNLILIDIYNPDGLAIELLEKGVQVESLGLDITDLNSLETINKLILEKQLEINGLVHLAGITKDKSLLKMEEQQWDDVINVNLKGTFNMLKIVAPHMKNRGGSIVFTGSTSARHGNFGQINYVASKGGVEAMTKTAARELARFNIRVNCIVPGMIKTPMTKKIPEKIYQQAISNIPLNRAGEPEEVAELIYFLINNKSSYITGTSIRIDGGLKI